jgi:hypothetical protein
MVYSAGSEQRIVLVHLRSENSVNLLSTALDVEGTHFSA